MFMPSRPNEVSSRIGPVVLGVCLLLMARVSMGMMSDEDRLLIEQVRVLEPAPEGFVERGPLDLVVDAGVLSIISNDSEVTLKPGQMKLRGRDRWLVPAPRARLARPPSSADLVLAGLSGLGGVIVPPGTAAADVVHARAALDAMALPVLLDEGVLVEGRNPPPAELGPTLRRVVEANGGCEAFLQSLAHSSDRRITPGIRASFLILSKDPRLHPETLLSPHAVVLGSDVILLPERETRLEEARVDEKRASLPSFEPIATPGQVEPSLARRYQLTVDGLVRGEALLEIRSLDEGMTARVSALTAAPLDETVLAESHWPSGTGRLHLSSQDKRVDAVASTVSDQDGPGLRLAIELDGDLVGGKSIPLQVDDHFLPHTLLMLLDAARSTSGVQTTGRAIEIELMNGFPGVYAAGRRTLRPLRSTDKPPLAPDQLLRLAGAPEATVWVLPSAGEDPDPPGFVILDEQRVPLFFILKTPWGTVEWAGSGPNAP